MLVALFASLISAPTAAAEEVTGDAAVAAAAAAGVTIDEEVDDTIVVYGDLFARWDDTRWFVKTEVAFPAPLRLYANRNYEIDVWRLAVRTVFACEKDWKMTRHKWQVHCTIEDIGLQAAAEEDPNLLVPVDEMRRRNREVLDELDAKLTGAAMQLQVTDDGRVTGVDLEGVEKDNQREKAVQEALRQIMTRAIVGYTLRLRKNDMLGKGAWVEYDSRLMSMPVSDGTSSRGSSVLLHNLSHVDGHVVVQSAGKGMIGDDYNFFLAEYTGVSVFDPEVGFMTERVWALRGKATGSSAYAIGQRAPEYFHAGRLRMLAPDDHPDCGTTQQAAFPNTAVEGLPAWMPLEGP